MVGGKPTPNEIKRLRGTARRDRTPPLSNVLALRPADGIPPCPHELGVAGRRLWDLVWENGLLWISPASDLEAVTQACLLIDAGAAAHERFMATRDPESGRLVAALAGKIQSALSGLGLDPTGRTRLGVAEVMAKSKLEQLKRVDKR